MVGLEILIHLLACQAGLKPNFLSPITNLIAIHGGAELADDAVVYGLAGEGCAAGAKREAYLVAAAEVDELLHLLSGVRAHDGQGLDIKIRGVARIHLAI